MRFSRPPALTESASEAQRAQVMLYNATVDILSDQKVENFGAIAVAQRWLEATSTRSAKDAENATRVRPFARFYCTVCAIVGTPRVQHNAVFFADNITEDRSLFDEIVDSAMETMDDLSKFHAFVRQHMAVLKTKLPDGEGNELKRLSARATSIGRARSLSARHHDLEGAPYEDLLARVKTDLQGFLTNVRPLDEGSRTQEELKTALDSLENCARANSVLERRMSDMSKSQVFELTRLRADLEATVKNFFKTADNQTIDMAELRQTCADLQQAIAANTRERSDGDAANARDVQGLNREISTLREQLRSQAADHRAEIDALKRAHQKESDATKTTITSLKEKVDEIARGVSSGDKRLQFVATQVERTRDESARVTRELERVASEQAQLRSSIGSFVTQQALDQLMTSFTATNTAAVDLVDFNKYALASQLDAYAARTQERIDAINGARADDVARQRTEVEELRHTLSEAASRTDHELAQLRARIQAVNDRPAERQPASEAVSREEIVLQFEAHSDRIARANEAIRKMNQVVNLINTQGPPRTQTLEMERLVKEHDDRLRNISDVNRQVREHEVRLADIAGQINALSMAIDDMRAFGYVDDAGQDVEAYESPDPQTPVPHGVDRPAAATGDAGAAEAAASPHLASLARCAESMVALAAVATTAASNTSHGRATLDPPTDVDDDDESAKSLERIERKEKNVQKNDYGLTTWLARHMTPDEMVDFWSKRFNRFCKNMQSKTQIAFEEDIRQDQANLQAQATRPSFTRKYNIPKRRGLLKRLMVAEITFSHSELDIGTVKGIVEELFDAIIQKGSGNAHYSFSYENVKTAAIARAKATPKNHTGRGSAQGHRQGAWRGQGRGGHQHHGQHQHSQQQQQQQQQPAQQPQQAPAAAPANPTQNQPQGLRSSGTVPFRTSGNPP